MTKLRPIEAVFITTGILVVFFFLLFAMLR